MDYICPACHRDVIAHRDAYRCSECGREYPIIYGIPDFRLNSDAYLGLEAERSKARVLAERAPELSFDSLVDYYYSITDDVPPELASVYKRSIVNGPEHLGLLASDIERSGSGAVLDAGCGSGSLLLALAGSERPVVGMDIALRWLVICQKRIEASGLRCQLVCADILHPPFREDVFDDIAGIDLLEHTKDMESASRSIAGLLRPGGRTWLTVSNRYCLGPHPSTRLWAIGYLPRKLAGRVSRALRNVDSLRHVHLTTPGRVAGILAGCGFDVELVQPRRISGQMQAEPPPLERALIKGYRLFCRWSPTRRLLVRVGPVSEIVARLPATRQHEPEKAA